VDFLFGTRPATVVSVVAKGDRDKLGCLFVVDRAVKAETNSHEVRDFAVIVFNVA
jgi:MmpS family membrane protein